MKGREPALAALANGGTALFWLNQRSNGRNSSQIWMAISPSSTQVFGPPVLIATGEFNRDTLLARGDGQGRVLLAVKSEDQADDGLKVFLLAPGLSEVPALTLVPSGNPAASALKLQWTANLLFPASAGIVERSADLTNWNPAANQLTPTPDGLSFGLMPTTPGPRYYRLRAAFSGN